MIHAVPTSLRHALDALPKLHADFSPVACWGDVLDDIAFEAVPDQTLVSWMQAAAAKEPCGDARLQAAYLMSDLAGAVGEVLAGLALRGYWLVSAGAGRVALTARQTAWEDDGETGVAQVFDVVLDPAGCGFVQRPNHKAFATAVEAIFGPFIRQLSAASGLGQPALFRLVGDSFGYAFLAHGRLLGCPLTGINHAKAIFQISGTKLRNKQLRFDYITLPEAPEIGDWLRVRGGCCRAYTRPGKPNYCTTCVLRDDDSRNERYRNFLRRKHVPTP